MGWGRRFISLVWREWGGQSEGMTTLGSHLLTSLGGRKPWDHGIPPGGGPKILGVRVGD